MAEQAGGLGILRTFSDNLETSQGRASRHYRRKKMKRRSRSVSEQIDELKATDGSVGKESECKDDDDNHNSSQRRLSNALKSPSQKSGSSKTPKWKSSNGGNYNNMDENSNDAQQGDERTLSRASSASLGFSFSIAGPAMTHPHVLDARKTVGVCSPGNRNNQEKNNHVILDVRDPRPKSTPPLPIAVKFSDVKYKVILNRTNFSFCKGPWNKTSVFMEKEILHGVTGSVLPGEVLALMGPSGSGKTTFINLLGGRIHQNVSGIITYNTQPYSKCLKRRIGFVQQDDILFPHLTVAETLVYAALLRLPNTLTRYQKRERAFDVVCELGLERCQDTIIGGPFVKGVSGGERKRVCIGHEILIDPSILILDEPTSGLDSTTALRIVQLLHNIAKTGRTILTTIHQPSSRLFHKFDKLILLGEGNPIYFGKASDAIQYFSSIGFSPLITMNPADFLLDLANGDINDVSVPKDLTEQIANKNPEGNQAEKPSSKDVLKHLVSSYHSHNAPEAKEKLLASESINEKSELVLSPAHEWGASWCEQFSILFKRGLKERRHEYLSGLRFAQVLSVALVLGLLWWQSKINTPKRLEDQTGLLFFIAVFWGFFPVFMAIFTFPQERAMLAKERGVDMYRLSAYFMARNLSDMPLDLLLPVIFMGIVYFMTNLRMTAMAFSLTLLTVFLSIIASQGLGLAIGASFMDVKKATTIASVAMMTFMLAGGFFVQHVPNFMRWIRYLSFNFYTYRLLIKIQYDYDQQYDCSSPIGCQSISTSPFLKGIPLDGGLTEAAIMLAMAIGYRAIAYISLRRMSLRV